MSISSLQQAAKYGYPVMLRIKPEDGWSGPYLFSSVRFVWMPISGIGNLSSGDDVAEWRVPAAPEFLPCCLAAQRDLKAAKSDEEREWFGRTLESLQSIYNRLLADEGKS